MGMIRPLIGTIFLTVSMFSGACSAQSGKSGPEATTQVSAMNDAPFVPGMVYSEKLANVFGLAPESVTAMKEPLLGSALDISGGVTGGHVCQLHVFMNAGTDVRLPNEPDLRSISASVTELPYALLKKPGAELKKLLGSQVRLLANRAIVRFGTGNLQSEVVASDDKSGSYVSLPLNEYNKELYPGVMWLSVPINCALAAESTYDTVSVFFEKSTSPQDMIINQLVSPDKMTSVDIPMALFKGMREDLSLALTRDEERKAPADRFRIFSE